MSVAELGLALTSGPSGLRASLRDLESELLLASGNVSEPLPSLPDEVVEAIAQEMGHRTVRLWLQADEEVRDASWESLTLKTLGGTPLGLTPGLRLVHESASVAKTKPLNVGGTPRVLIVSANPANAIYPRLESAANEVHSVATAFDSSENRRCHVESLVSASVPKLKSTLSKWKPNVFHFVGHGDMDANGGFLVFEGTSERLYGCDLGRLLIRAGTRMAILSGCFTASGTGSVAETLIEQGIECVIGMRGTLDDGASHLFARALYAALAEGSSVDEAVWQGRKAISGSPTNWSVPVLIARRPLSALFPVQRSAQRRTNLTGDPNAFVGRANEKAELRRVLADPRRRLTTVHGLGGMGKTRLCREIARESVSRFDAVWSIDCESVTHVDELFPSIAATIRVTGTGNYEEVIADAIGQDRVLLLLDGLDTANPELSSRIDHLLDSCPQLRILATSREPLDSKHARRVELGPMAFPARGRSEAMRLFLDAAEHASPGFRLRDGDRPIVQNLLSNLDGIPLAIILVAGRLAYLDVRTLASLAQDDVYGAAAGLESEGRHSTLERALRGSFEALDEEERLLMRDLSVFRGGFTFEDASAIMGDAFGLLRGIGQLRRRGLLSLQPMRSEHRYRVLHTVRTYLKRVASVEPPCHVRLAHAEHYALDAVMVRKQLDSGDWASGNARLWSENGNYDAALSFAAKIGENRLIVSFATALARPYYEAGAMLEFERLGECCADIDEDNLRIEMDGLRGSHARRNGNPLRAHSIWLARAERCMKVGRFDDYADSLLDCADLALELDQTQKAQELLDQVDSPASEYSPLVRAGYMLVRARLSLQQGDLRSALDGAQEAEALAERVADHRLTPYLWRALAEVYRKVGDLPRSERMARRLVAEALVAGYYQSAGSGLLELSETLESMNRLDSAAEAIAVANAIPSSVSSVLRNASSARYRTFDSRHGSGLLTAFDDRLKMSLWTIVAAKIGDEYSHN
ncbi:CHAT domain-containing protein [bacterium]|nr:MAG: CHAT domain-containing protein [bacterium]